MARRQTKLTKSERTIEAALLRGEFQNVSPAEFRRIKRAVAAKRKAHVKKP